MTDILQILLHELAPVITSGIAAYFAAKAAKRSRQMRDKFAPELSSNPAVRNNSAVPPVQRGNVS